MNRCVNQTQSDLGQLSQDYGAGRGVAGSTHAVHSAHLRFQLGNSFMVYSESMKVQPLTHTIWSLCASVSSSGKWVQGPYLFVHLYSHSGELS